MTSIYIWFDRKMVDESALKYSLQLVDCIKAPIVECVNTTIALNKWFSSFYATEKAKEPIYYNILHDCESNGAIKETQHSRILCSLLSSIPIREHFIQFFFPDINLNGINTIVHYPDQDRIDLAIEGKDKKEKGAFFIIIENKINFAEEQEAQVERYINIAKEGYGYSMDNVYVLYLNSDNDSTPSEKSLSPDTKEELGKRLVCTSYKNDIIGWLRKEEPRIDSEKEPYLYKNLILYKEYLEDKYNLINRYENMRETIKKALIDKLELGDSPESRENDIKTLKDTIDNINILQTHLNDMLLEYQFNLWRSKFEERFKDVVLESNEHDPEGKVEFAFYFNNKLYYCAIGRESSKIPFNFDYAGIHSTGNNTREQNAQDFNELKSLVEGELGSNGLKSNSWWPFWYAVLSSDDAMNCFWQLSEIIIEKTKSEPEKFSLVKK